MDLEKYLKNGKVDIWEEKFAVIKSREIDKNAFANIIDKNEITVIIDQEKVDENKVIEIEKDWKLLTFDMVLPFELTGFIAHISKKLEEEGIAIFVVSSFSTDHVLVKEKDLDRTKDVLRSIGCKLK